MTTKTSFLIYRNNRIWSALTSELTALAQACGTATVKIFKPNTPEQKIKSWIQKNARHIKQANMVFADSTCRRPIVTSRLKKSYDVSNLEDFMKEAADQVFHGVSPAETYRQIYARIINTLGVKRVQIVLDNLADYNPLNIREIADNDDLRYDKDALWRYAEEFKKLLPKSVQVEFIRGEKLQLPDKQTLVVVHHHTLNGLKNGEKLRQSPRLFMPYPKGLIEKAGSICDIGDIAQTDLLEAMRSIIQTMTRQSIKESDGN